MGGGNNGKGDFLFRSWLTRDDVAAHVVITFFWIDRWSTSNINEHSNMDIRDCEDFCEGDK